VLLGAHWVVIADAKQVVIGRPDNVGKQTGVLTNTGHSHGALKCALRGRRPTTCSTVVEVEIERAHGTASPRPVAALCPTATSQPDVSRPNINAANVRMLVYCIAIHLIRKPVV
jgi:microcystin-dependent protein